MGLFTMTRRNDFVLSNMPALVLSEGEWWSFPVMVVENWQQLAAYAWDGYLTAGRGFVRLNKERGFGYVSAAAPGLVASREPEDRNTCDKCARYRPEQEFVLTGHFARDEKARNIGKTELLIGVMRPWLKGMLTPPDAYREVKTEEVREASMLYLQARRRTLGPYGE